MLLQDTGMRIGECLEMNVADLDFHHRMILLCGIGKPIMKSGKQSEGDSRE